MLSPITPPLGPAAGDPRRAAARSQAYQAFTSLVLRSMLRPALQSSALVSPDADPGGMYSDWLVQVLADSVAAQAGPRLFPAAPGLNSASDAPNKK